MKQTDRDRDTMMHRVRESQTETARYIKINRDIYKQRDRQTEINRSQHIQLDRQTYSTDSNGQTDRQTEIQ